MTADGSKSSADTLWIETIATKLGLDRLSGRVTLSGTPLYGPVFLLTLMPIIDIVILSGIKIPRPGVYRINNAGAPALLVGWPLAALIMLDLRNKYNQAIDKIPSPDDDIGRSVSTVEGLGRRVLERLRLLDPSAEASFHPLIPHRLKLGFLVFAIGFHYVWISMSPLEIPLMTELHTLENIRVFVKFYVFIPLTYYVAGTEFISLFTAINLLLPFRVRKTGAIDFTDPQGYGGLRPVGALLLRASVLFSVVLTVFALFVSLPGGISWGEPIPKFLLVGGSAVAILLFVIPVFWLHRYMAALKELKIDAIASRVRQVGPDEKIFPDADFETTDDVMAFTHEYISLKRVENTAEYPVDVQMLQNLVGMLVLPYVTSYTSSIIFAHLP